MPGSESVFNLIQFGAQSGTAYSPGSAVPATVLVPVDSPVTFDLDRASQFPKQDRGRNVRNSAGQGYNGIRGAGCVLPTQVSFEYLADFLEMLAIIVVPMAQVYMFGLLIGNKRHAWCLFTVMLGLYLLSFGVAWYAETRPTSRKMGMTWKLR